MVKLKKGILIGIEGIDGSGKSTLSRLLKDLFALQNMPVILTKEPGGSELGRGLRRLLQTKELSMQAEYLLFAADRAQHFKEVVLPALTDRKIVLSDRTGDSSIAYQGYGRGLDIDMIRSVNNWSTSTCNPDLIVYVKVPMKIAMERINRRGKISSFEQHNLLQKVQEGFDNLYKNKSNVLHVDGTKDQCVLAIEVHKQITKWLGTNQCFLP